MKLGRLRPSCLLSVLFNDHQLFPSKIVCIGRNYVEHIQELGNEVPESLVVFIKPNSAITNTLRSTFDEPLHYEAELAFLVEGGEFKAVALGLDLTKRDLQAELKSKGLPWERSKAFDGAALFSEFVPFSAYEDLSLRLDINNEPTQQGGVELMLNKPDEIYRVISEFMTLSDGDIVMTGTPKGLVKLKLALNFTDRCFKAKR